MRIDVTPRPAIPRATPRLIAALAMFAISAAAFCAVVGYVLVRQTDERQQIERRGALVGAIEDLRASGIDISSLDPPTIRGMERTAGLKDLRFDPDPEPGVREMQSVLDRNGRIVGWFSWEADRSMAIALSRMQPLLLVTGLCFVIFAGVALWQVRRMVRDLGEGERRAWSLAHEDMLTGMPNRRKMMEWIDNALAARGPEEVTTLAFIDLDGLGDVNDAHGQHVGDRLLVEWAARLKEMLPSRATAGRLDGDQFVVAMTAIDTAKTETAMRIAIKALARPFWIDQQVVRIGATMGLAHVPRDGQSRDDVMRRADLALRAGKRRHRGGITVFDTAMDVEFDDRRFLERELRQALAAGAIDVHYQPILTSDGARIVSTEALARWTHPQRGEIPPAVFVAAAEQAGLMGELGAFMLRRALTDAKRWPELTVAVNLSPVQVRDRQLADIVAAALAETGTAPERLLLEVTEGVLIDDPEAAKARLDALRELGVRLALDDFGTGYSSLSYLQRFCFDKLKIDRSFVAPLARSSRSQAMIQAIVSLGRALDLTLLAEGVETEEQRVLLRLAGCEELQGHLFGRAGPPEELDRLMEQARAAPAAKRPALRAV
jgi:diguanylate cyclase (GGDEF)-like protein